MTHTPWYSSLAWLAEGLASGLLSSILWSGLLWLRRHKVIAWLVNQSPEQSAADSSDAIWVEGKRMVPADISGLGAKSLYELRDHYGWWPNPVNNTWYRPSPKPFIVASEDELFSN